MPAGSKLARFATFDADYPAGTDVDIAVVRQEPDGTLTPAGTSASGSSEESVTVTEPGTYVVSVNLFAASGQTNVKLDSWVVPPGNAGNLTVSPASQR